MYLEVWLFWFLQGERWVPFFGLVAGPSCQPNVPDMEGWGWDSTSFNVDTRWFIKCFKSDWWNIPLSINFFFFHILAMSNIFYYIINKSDIACSMWRVSEFHAHDVFLEQEAPYLFHHNSTLFYYFYTQKKKKKTNIICPEVLIMWYLRGEFHFKLGLAALAPSVDHKDPAIHRYGKLCQHCDCHRGDEFVRLWAWKMDDCIHACEYVVGWLQLCIFGPF